MTAIIEVHDLVKRFGEHTAVNGINFEVEQGEVFGLLGPNGAGKSTTIKMLITLLPPTSGGALVAGYDIVHQTADVR
ncbi:MAG TPA: ATP-binding cassette domain-containing protein, partial [Ktedonobacteraceae bacterium]|nr:ATP-binding cassette domain-containing protein [Ktedonobacteraceae bacterium]